VIQVSSQRWRAGRRAFFPALVIVLVLGLAAMPAAGAARSGTTSKPVGWGRNDNGQLGDGSIGSKNTPVPIKLPKGTNLRAISAGQNHSVAVTSTGAALAWGYNGYGQLGNGTNASSDVPIKVKLPAGTKTTAASASERHSLFLTSKGAVLATGWNGFGQLGDGSTTSSNVPVRVKLPKSAKVTEISAGWNYSLAVTSTGSVYAWGQGDYGKLGDGSTTSRDLPVKVKLPKGVKVTAVSAGASHSLALTSTGSMYAWGHGGFGELGDGSTSGSDVPVKVKLPKGVKASRMSAGANHSLAVTSTGKVLAWGENNDGQVGDGTTTNAMLPTTVKLPKGLKITQLAGGFAHSVALSSKGTVVAWGYNADGELGNGMTSNSLLPVKVKLPKHTVSSAIFSGSMASASFAFVHHT
jgi:alpha-tubulin suppressor-like RCC1 family protein